MDKMSESKMSRRKYVAAAGGIAVVAVIGGVAAYYLTRPAPPTPKELSIFGQGPSVEETVMEELAKRWKRDHPNFEIKTEWTGGAGGVGYIDALKAKVLAGAASDIMWDNSGTHGEDVIAMGGLASLKEFYDKYKIWDRVIGGDPAKNPNSMAVLLVYSPTEPPKYVSPPAPNAEPYFVGTNAVAWGMFYNPAIFDQYHVDPDIQTWDELSAACETFKRERVIPIAIQAQAPWEVEHFFDILLVNVKGGCIDNPKLLSQVLKGEAAWTDEPFMNAMKYYQDYRDKGYFQEGALGMDPDSVTLLFTEGKSAMYCQGSWMIATMKETAPDFKFDILPNCWPTIRTDKKKYIIGGCCQGWGLNPKAKNKEDVYEFFEFMTRPEQMSLWPELVKELCIYKDVTPLKDPLYNKFGAMFPNMYIWIDQIFGSLMRDRLRLNLKGFINLEMSGEQVLTDLEAYSKTVRQG